LFKTLFNAWKVKDLRKKILWTFFLLVIFRFGAFITAPGVDGQFVSQIMAQNSNGFFSMLNTITGSAFSQLSIFAMSIGPYITASIVIQLLTVAIPSLEELSKEGEAGRRKISDYTKYLAVVLAAIEAFGVYMTYRYAGGTVAVGDSTVQKTIFMSNSFLIPVMFIFSLTAGSSLLMWIADKISSLGVGNGTSLLIFAGIVSRFPSAVTYFISDVIGIGEGNTFNPIGLVVTILVLIGAILLIAGVVWVTEAERRVPVQYAKRVVGRKMYGGQSTNIPIKLAMAGVMPIIFAMSLMQFPAMIIQIINPNAATDTGFWAGVYKVCAFSSLSGSQNMWGYGIAHTIIYLFLISVFTYFYTKMIFNTTEVANNLKKSGGFIPGIRAGKPTSDYLSNILKYVTAFGSIFLGIVAVIPIIIQFTGLQVSFGGTAILIVVSVALETIKQLEAQMMVRNYKGFLD